MCHLDVRFLIISTDQVSQTKVCHNVSLSLMKVSIETGQVMTVGWAQCCLARLMNDLGCKMNA